MEALAEQVVVIDDGWVLAHDSLDAVRSRVNLHRVSVRLAGGCPALPGVVRHETEGALTDLLSSDADELVPEMVRTDVPFTDLQVRGASLEEAFLALTTSRTEEVPA